ncbi:MAG: ferritin-like domain-containing protein [Chitinophagaceae bacterium]|jgi:ferritin-like metal-binding protein YciE|nr:ferritin-like domain-containing protein [Chitinophagaceae bacterium]
MANTKQKSGTTTTNKSTATKSASNSTQGSNGNSSKGSMLEDFVLDQLKDIYWAEKHLVKGITKMQKASTTTELQTAFEDHKAATETHITRLEEAFEMLGKKAQAKKCEAMEGLTKEAESIIEETEKGSMTRDVALIVAAQKIEHYEIASYGGLVQLAKTMGNNELAKLLQKTLDEEKETDLLLTEIAENNINWEAEQEAE